MLVRKWGRRERHTLLYPKYCYSPRELLTFIEMNGFFEEWLALGLSEDDLSMFQMAIMAAPKANREVVGAGGLRVLEMCRDDDQFRVDLGYVYFDWYGIVVLII